MQRSFSAILTAEMTLRRVPGYCPMAALCTRYLERASCGSMLGQCAAIWPSSRSPPNDSSLLPTCGWPVPAGAAGSPPTRGRTRRRRPTVRRAPLPGHHFALGLRCAGAPRLHCAIRLHGGRQPPRSGSAPVLLQAPPLGLFMGPHGHARAAGAAARPAPGRVRIQARKWGTPLPLPNGCVPGGDTGKGEGPWRHKCSPWCEQCTGTTPDAWRSHPGNRNPGASDPWGAKIRSCGPNGCSSHSGNRPQGAQRASSGAGPVDPWVGPAAARTTVVIGRGAGVHSL